MYFQNSSSFSPSNHASTQQQQNVIKVTGEGIISVAPDQAFINIGVITESQNLSEAQTENSATMTAVIQALLELGIPKEQIQTIIYRVEMQYDYQDGKQLLRGYQVNHQIQVRIDQIDMTGKIVDTAVQSGANYVSDIRFTISNEKDYYNQALTFALENSHQKALTLVNRMGVTLYPYPHQIQEVTQAVTPIPFQTMQLAKAETTPIQPGQIQITANLIAEYLFFS